MTWIQSTTLVIVEINLQHMECVFSGLLIPSSIQEDIEVTLIQELQFEENMAM